MKKLKIHLGCGKRNFGHDWVHIDGGDYAHITSKDIVNLQYDDNTVDEIYCSHVIAYFDRVEGLEVLKKWYQKLKPGGVLRLATPDFGALVYLYQNQGYMLENILGPLYGKMPMGDQTIFHKTTYDWMAMKQTLVMAGFSSVKQYDWKQTEHAHFDDHSHAYMPHDEEAIKTGNFTTEHTLISLNVEAIK